MTPLAHIDLLARQESLRLGQDDQGLTTVFDPVRRKFVRATPEEIVRQLWLLYFLEEKHFNPKLIAVERSIKVHDRQRRFDIVIFDRSTQPVLLVELKSPNIAIHQNAFDQIAQYNMALQVPFALVSNGEHHYCFQINDEERKFTFLADLPFEGN